MSQPTVVEDVGVGLAGAAAAGAHLPELEGAAEEPLELLLEGGGEGDGPVGLAEDAGPRASGPRGDSPSVKAIAPRGQASSQSAQKRHLPRSRREGRRARASGRPWGRPSAQASQSVGAS